MVRSFVRLTGRFFLRSSLSFLLSGRLQLGGCLFVCLFVCSLVRSFVHSTVRPFGGSAIWPFGHLAIRAFFGLVWLLGFLLLGQIQAALFGEHLLSDCLEFSFSNQIVWWEARRGSLGLLLLVSLASDPSCLFS